VFKGAAVTPAELGQKSAAVTFICVSEQSFYSPLKSKDRFY